MRFVFWVIVVPSAITIVLVLSYNAWLRICSFMSSKRSQRRRLANDQTQDWRVHKKSAVGELNASRASQRPYTANERTQVNPNRWDNPANERTQVNPNHSGNLANERTRLNPGLRNDPANERTRLNPGPRNNPANERTRLNPSPRDNQAKPDDDQRTL